MPERFRYLSFAICTLALLVTPVARAQQLATNAPSSTPTASTNAPSSTPTASTNAPSSTLTSPTDAAQKMIVEAINKVNANDTDGALNTLSQALKLNPNSTGAYVLRASIYSQKKQWAQAEDDFKAAQRIAPTNIVVKFNLVEIKFLQKQYDAARPGFVALEKDPDLLKSAPEMVDFASYKVFLCDLFGGHEDAAKKELDAFNDAGGNPSYFFSNAAWSLFHKNTDDARGWLLSASNIYPLQKNSMYASSLRDLGYLPLPQPTPK